MSKRPLRGRNDSEDVSGTALGRTFLGDGKTSLEIRLQRTGERRKDRKLGTRSERALRAT